MASVLIHKLNPLLPTAARQPPPLGFCVWMYVHDLRRLPHLPSLVRLKALSPALVKSCSDILNQVREKHWNAYERLAMEVESFLTAELAQMTAEDLGSIDTFREPKGIRMLDGSVEALLRGDWKKAKEWCDARQGARSFWLARDQESKNHGRGLSWTRRRRLVKPSSGTSARLRTSRASRMRRSDMPRVRSRSIVPSDVSEQQRLVHLEPRLPHFGLLQEGRREPS